MLEKCFVRNTSFSKIMGIVGKVGLMSDRMWEDLEEKLDVIKPRTYVDDVLNCKWNELLREHAKLMRIRESRMRRMLKFFGLSHWKALAQYATDNSRHDDEINGRSLKRRRISLSEELDVGLDRDGLMDALKRDLKRIIEVTWQTNDSKSLQEMLHFLAVDKFVLGCDTSDDHFDIMILPGSEIVMSSLASSSLLLGRISTIFDSESRKVRRRRLLTRPGLPE